MNVFDSIYKRVQHGACIIVPQQYQSWYFASKSFYIENSFQIENDSSNVIIKQILKIDLNSNFIAIVPRRKYICILKYILSKLGSKIKYLISNLNGLVMQTIMTIN